MPLPARARSHPAHHASQWVPADYLHVDRSEKSHARWWSSWRTGRSQRCKRSSVRYGRRRDSRHLSFNSPALPTRCVRGYSRPNAQRQDPMCCRRSTALRSINAQMRPGPTTQLPRHGCTVRSEPATCGVLQRRPPGTRSHSRCLSEQGAVRPGGHPSISGHPRAASRLHGTHKPCMIRMSPPCCPVVVR